jgi:hypothetical protein
MKSRYCGLKTRRVKAQDLPPSRRRNTSSASTPQRSHEALQNDLTKQVAGICRQKFDVEVLDQRRSHKASGRRRRKPTAGRFFFPTATISYSEPVGSETSRMTAPAAYVSSLEGKEEKLVALCYLSFGYDAHNLFYVDEQKQLVSLAFDASAGKVSGNTTVVSNAVGLQPSTAWRPSRSRRMGR